ncbi:MBL fold metallo-hydrolase [bacterium]|nr:MBL fold metallo-hydrolase [bacterium]
MRVQFWGVRGSIPTPISPADVESKVIAMAEDVVRAGIRDPEQVSGYLREHHSMLVRGTVGGNTTCISADWDGGSIIFDAGSGIRNLGRHLMDGPASKGEAELNIAMSHTHWDHIQGFPFFGPLFQRNKITIHGGHENLEGRYRGQQMPDYFPIGLDVFPADIRFNKVEPGQRYPLPGGGSFIPKELQHPGKSFGYRVEHGGKSMVFASDSEYKRDDDEAIREMIEFVRETDLFVFDSQYTLEESLVKEDWGHSTAVIGVDIAVRANVKRLALFHHEPNYPDSFIRELLLKARRYLQLNYPDAELDIFVAIEGIDLQL